MKTKMLSETTSPLTEKAFELLSKVLGFHDKWVELQRELIDLKQCVFCGKITDGEGLRWKSRFACWDCFCEEENPFPEEGDLMPPKVDLTSKAECLKALGANLGGNEKLEGELRIYEVRHHSNGLHEIAVKGNFVKVENKNG